MEKETILTASWEIQTTVGTGDVAERLAQELVNNRLVACTQIYGPLTSIYRWKGEVQRESEFRLTLKTSDRLMIHACQSLRALHPYELPEISSRRLETIDGEFEAWINAETRWPRLHLKISPGDANPSVSFEELNRRLSEKPRLHFELDGSFVWRCEAADDATDSPAWQVDGMVYDRNGRVELVELKGNFDRAAWLYLTSNLGFEELDQLPVQFLSSGEWTTAATIHDMIE